MRYNKETIKQDGRVLRGGGPRDLQRHKSLIDIDQSVIIKELRIQIKELTTALAIKPNVSAEDFDEELRESIAQAVKETKIKFSTKIKKLEQELCARDSGPVISNDLFTSEQVDGEINKSVSEAVSENSAKYEKDINKLTTLLNEKDDECKKITLNYENLIINSDDKLENLNSKIKSLKLQFKDKDKVIEALEKNAVAALDFDDEKIAKLVVDKIGRLRVDGETGQVIDSNRPQIDIEFVDPTEVGVGDNYESHISVKEESKEENLSFKAEKLKNIIGGKLPQRKI